MDRQINEINRFTVKINNLLQTGRHPNPIRGPRRMAQTPTAASAIEKVEAPPHTQAQPANTQYLRNKHPPINELAQKILTDRRLQTPRRRDAQRLPNHP